MVSTVYMSQGHKHAFSTGAVARTLAVETNAGTVWAVEVNGDDVGTLVRDGDAWLVKTRDGDTERHTAAWRAVRAAVRMVTGDASAETVAVEYLDDAPATAASMVAEMGNYGHAGRTLRNGRHVVAYTDGTIGYATMYASADETTWGDDGEDWLEMTAIVKHDEMAATIADVIANGATR